MAGGRKLARAQQRYENLWGRGDVLLGADGKPSPLIGWGESNYPGLEDRNYVYHDAASAIRKIFTTDQLVRELGAKTKQPGLKAKKNSNRRVARAKSQLKRGLADQAKGTLLHEFAHIYQDADLIDHVNPDLREGGADLFANYARQQLGLPPGANYPDSFKQDFVAVFGKDAWRQAQFGKNWGADPRGIKYPGVAPEGAAKNKGKTLRKALRQLKQPGQSKQDVRRAKRVLTRHV